MSRVRNELKAHPGAVGAALDVRIAASAERTAHGFEFEFELAGDLDGIVWPPTVPPERADGLWRHTCFEAFCATPGAGAYYEFNFSPSGRFAVYRFGGYRERVADPELASAPVIARRESGALLVVDISIDVARLPRLKPSAPLEFALAAVIEGRDGRVHHFALGHPCEQPDFHDRRGFLLALPGFGGPAA